MVRECAATLALLLTTPACSLLLDFSDPPPTAPYTQTECNYHEPNDSRGAAAPITPADAGPAAICPGATEDHDFYQFSVPPGTARVEFKLDYVDRSGGDLDLRLYDGTATPPVSNSFGDEERITCPGASPRCEALAAGDYVFEVFPASGAVNRYTFSLVLTPM